MPQCSERLWADRAAFTGCRQSVQAWLFRRSAQPDLLSLSIINGLGRRAFHHHLLPRTHDAPTPYGGPRDYLAASRRDALCPLSLPLPQRLSLLRRRWPGLALLNRCLRCRRCPLGPRPQRPCHLIVHPRALRFQKPLEPLPVTRALSTLTSPVFLTSHSFHCVCVRARPPAIHLTVTTVRLATRRLRAPTAL
ncbi:hypothetical protein BS50DRAFT_233358 [Corynespora cassiicola Philippines]|uniref:Uncharacterized protein n=1 Tax=Corynespora cassiicola Philippines TaxID=1448308 RepID=A0A2T2P1W7_CORCC|nr:hypothetical protein BS50DRAFT_233358 [Corynespora cassiicola Philippines]